jgi:protein-tyrosine-phosphatase
MRILFVCRHNRFRSKVAEAYFNKINKNKAFVAKSAGIFPGSYPLDKQQTQIAKQLGIKMGRKPQAITTKLLRWQNVIIAITDDLPRGLFNYSVHKNKVINWKIPDEMKGDGREVERIIKQIMKKVEKLVK